MSFVLSFNTPRSLIEDKYLRERLILRPKEGLELAQHLDNFYETSWIRGYHWDYKATFIETLIDVLENQGETH